VRPSTVLLVSVASCVYQAAADVRVFCCVGSGAGKETALSEWQEVGSGTLKQDKSSDIVLSGYDVHLYSALLNCPTGHLH
jgi:hypothetical protein